MILGENIGSVYSNGREIQRVFSKGKLVWEKKNNDDIDYSVLPFTVKAIAADVSVKLRVRDMDGIRNYKYSINGGSWIETDTSTTINIKKNDEVSFIGRDIRYCDIIGLSDVCGNIMSLGHYDDFIGAIQWWNKYGLDESGFFMNCDIRNAKKLILPATKISGAGYANMFRNCKSLITPPKILFSSKLTGESCYYGMFYGCTSLTTAPELPATTLANKCYMYMFYGCTSLTTAPELPATTLKSHCYFGMFENCTSLTTAPELPANTLAGLCYYGMFTGCTSLTTAPELPATTLTEWCYYDMFENCTSLNYIKCYATNDIKNYAVKNWTYGISTNGKLLCKRVNGGKNPLEDYIPSTWSVEYFT